MNGSETQFQIGQLLDETATRDAIHIAVLPVEAGEDLRRGQYVKLSPGTGRAVKAGPADALGIADPFLTDGAGEGERFWLFLTPNTITGMRHHWQHPAVDGLETVAAPRPSRAYAQEWLQAFAGRWGMNYDSMISIATEAPADGDGDPLEWIIAHDRDLHGADELDPGEHEEFWRCLEALTGRTFDAVHRARVGWSCSC